MEGLSWKQSDGPSRLQAGPVKVHDDLSKEGTCPNWDSGLPLDILSHVAAGRDELKAMRLACRSWQCGFERSVTRIKINLEGPELPRDAPERFQGLTSLDLGNCAMDEDNLQILAGFPKLATLILGNWHQLRPFVKGCNPKDIPLFMKLSDRGLEHLQGLPLTSLDLGLCTCLSDEGKLSF